ncbi:hypothetical protein L207DRAFT_590394 [Hyaloscypha variabilis F]|uniref:Uncharacterized protein n=1 Tax=Hyaloscypha variabilis (strain UAMH 11265 / GT02V1 / F) TaxID=1149755 RepID=A0A2J6R2F5_HYAVF|nr:hypothetical protein L207DRAFT_590394 [Hyaloscypha variabilis F]
MAALTSEYSPVEDVDDAGSEELFLVRCEACGNPQSDPLSKSKATQHWRLLLIHVGAILFYSIVAILATYYFNTRNCHRQSLIYSPASTVIEYNAQIYSPSLLGDPEYFGWPSAQIDENWNLLLEPSSIHLTEAERQHYDPGTPIVQFPDGTYFGQLMVYKRLYQYINSEYYFPNLTDREEEMNRRHTEHCLGTLRQGIMCHGDVSVMPMVWGKHTSVPLGDFSNPHACVNFDRLHKWARSRAVTNALEPGVLVHPKLGPSFPSGHGTKIGFSDEDIDENGNIVKDD